MGGQTFNRKFPPLPSVSPRGSRRSNATSRAISTVRSASKTSREPILGGRCLKQNRTMETRSKSKLGCNPLSSLRFAYGAPSGTHARSFYGRPLLCCPYRRKPGVSVVCRETESRSTSINIRRERGREREDDSTKLSRLPFLYGGPFFAEQKHASTLRYFRYSRKKYCNPQNPSENISTVARSLSSEDTEEN